jgi:hypothetical protein
VRHTHTFACGIVAESHSCGGDQLLAQMITGRRIYEFPGIRNLPPDFVVRLDCLFPWGEDKDKWRQAVNAMLRRGYDMIEYRRPDTFDVIVRFKWRKP